MPRVLETTLLDHSQVWPQLQLIQPDVELDVDFHAKAILHTDITKHNEMVKEISNSQRGVSDLDF